MSLPNLSSHSRALPPTATLLENKCYLMRGIDIGAVYSQLSITERRKIERWRHAKVPVDEMARVLKRCRSTIFRELKRNFFLMNACQNVKVTTATQHTE